MNKKKRPVGRPSIYTEKLANEICNRLANGESLKSICNDHHMPHRETVRVWRHEISEFSAMYALAREQQAENFLDEMIEIADTVIEDSAAIQKAKLQVDTRKYVAEKLAPKQYGTHHHNLTSRDGSMSPKNALTPEQFAEIAKTIVDKV